MASVIKADVACTINWIVFVEHLVFYRSKKEDVLRQHRNEKGAAMNKCLECLDNAFDNEYFLVIQFVSALVVLCMKF